MKNHPGVVSIPSGLRTDAIVQRLKDAIAAHGLTLSAVIDHAAAAQAAGMALRPTVLLIFGAARGGTPLMQLDQIVGIDLPLRILVWEDEQAQTWISYVDPKWIVQLRVLGEGAAATAERLAGVLSALAEGAGAGPGG